MVGESKFHNFILGSVFLGGILLIGLATLLVRGFGFSERQEIDIRFDNVANLARGEPVVVHGVRVGEVSDVRYARAPGEAGDVLVVVSVEKAVFPLPPETQFVVRSLGPLGGKYVEIVLPENGAAPNGGGAPRSSAGQESGNAPPVGDDASAPQSSMASPPQSLFFQVAHAQESDRPTFRGTAERDALEQLGDLVREIREGDGLLPRLIRDEGLARTAEQAMAEFGGTFETLNRDLAEGRGLIGRLLRDEALADEVSTAVTEIRRVFETLNAEEGILRDLEATSDDLRAIVSGVRQGEGIAGLLLVDADARAKADTIITELSSAAERISNRSSIVGRLLNDEALADRFSQAIEDLADVADKANNGEGILPQLLNDSEAWTELRRVLVLARESIEDLREQAPINTFANVLFSVF